MQRVIILLCTSLLCVIMGEAHAARFCVSGFDSAKTVQVRVQSLTSSTTLQAWTSTGVTESANGQGKSTYCHAGTSPTACHDLLIDWQDNSAPIRTASEPVPAWNCTSDPWSTALPGAYIAGTAGYILGNYSQGSGNTAVNHNTGGSDNLRYTTALGAGISGAVIKAYLKTDYDARNRTDAFVKGRTVTDVNGRWVNDLYLDGGYTYTILYYKPGAYGPNTREVTLP